MTAAATSKKILIAQAHAIYPQMDPASPCLMRAAAIRRVGRHSPPTTVSQERQTHAGVLHESTQALIVLAVARLWQRQHARTFRTRPVDTLSAYLIPGQVLCGGGGGESNPPATGPAAQRF
jgi:hypothetical protein